MLTRQLQTHPAFENPDNCSSHLGGHACAAVVPCRSMYIALLTAQSRDRRVQTEPSPGDGRHRIEYNPAVMVGTTPTESLFASNEKSTTAATLCGLFFVGTRIALTSASGRRVGFTRSPSDGRRQKNSLAPTGRSSRSAASKADEGEGPGGEADVGDGDTAGAAADAGREMGKLITRSLRASTKNKEPWRGGWFVDVTDQ